MLALSRRVGEVIEIGGNVRVTVVAVKGNRVRLGVEAPPDVDIRRSELPAESPEEIALKNVLSHSTLQL